MAEYNGGPVLCVLAAGIGSRFGGLKQIADADGRGHALLDYAIYDAIEAGFKKIVFIIRKDIEKDFRDAVGKRVEEKIPVEYVYQELSKLPEGYEIPAERVKPWGTTHAIWCARKALGDADFLTVNGDDFYGKEAYKLAIDFFNNSDDDTIGIIGYDLVSTLSKNGTVSRGVCKEKDGYLERIDELKKISLKDGKAFYTLDEGQTYSEIPSDRVASMNMWAFKSVFMKDIEKSFTERFIKGLEEAPLKFEETLSDAVQSLNERGGVKVRIVPTDSMWFGMTYKEDMPVVRDTLNKLTEEGLYPKEAW